MNKLLTTITLLCFSVVANAEVYLCTEKKAVSMDRMRVFNPPMRDEGEIISIFLVDPERGFKKTWIEEDYSGAYSSGDVSFEAFRWPASAKTWSYRLLSAEAC
tara:strand:+ start:523 stop:831 length:309 start_codon:yes stop_codon:yes gene_type:complete